MNVERDIQLPFARLEQNPAAAQKSKQSPHDYFQMYHDIIRPVVTAYAELFSLVAFVIGLYGGHRFALVRDRRREFNAIVEPIREELRAETLSPNPNRLAIDVNQDDQLIWRMGFLKKHKYRKAYEAYKEQKKGVSEDEIGQPIHAVPDKVSAAAHSLLKILSPQ